MVLFFDKKSTNLFRRNKGVKQDRFVVANSVGNYHKFRAQPNLPNNYVHKAGGYFSQFSAKRDAYLDYEIVDGKPIRGEINRFAGGDKKNFTGR